MQLRLLETRTVRITHLGQRSWSGMTKMMLANIVSWMTQICKFCHLYWLNVVLFFVTKLVSNEPTKTDFIFSWNPKSLTEMSYKYSENRFPCCGCCKICCSTMSTANHNESFMFVDHNVCQADLIQWINKNAEDGIGCMGLWKYKWCQLKFASQRHCKI